MKYPVIVLLVGPALLALCGCAAENAPSTSTTASLSSGNWVFYVNSSTPSPVDVTDRYPRNVPMRGPVVITNGILIAEMITNGASEAPCFPADIVFSGAITGDALSLTATPNPSLLSMKAMAKPSSILLGTYSCTSVLLGEDAGSLYGTYVPPVTGTYTGTLTDANTFKPVPPVSISAALTQAPSATITNGINANPNTFPLSGSIVLTNAACFPAGPETLVVDSAHSFVGGDQVTLVATDSTTIFNFTSVLTDPSKATSMYATGNAASLSATNCSVNFPTYPTANYAVLSR